MPTVKKPESQACVHIDEALRLVGRGGDKVQVAVQHLALGLKALVEELNG